MYESLNNFISLFENNTIFLFCALAGTGLLIIQFMLNLIGLSDGDDFDDSEISTEKKFKCLSIQTIGGFLMMFGWTAMSCQNEFHLSTWLSIFLSLLIGLCTAFILNLLFKIAMKVQSPGNVCDLDEIIGKEAFVYQRIPKDGVGKISISFQHLTHEIDAISSAQEELPSFSLVQIIKKKDESTVVVIPIANR